MIGIAFAAAVFAASSGSGSASIESLKAYHWEKRIIVIFAEESDARISEHIHALLQDPDGLAERDILVLAVVGDDLKEVYGPTPSGLEARTLRQEFAVEKGTPFVAILIGKDGGVKLRSQRPVDLPELFSLIDAMPMRRSGQ